MDLLDITLLVIAVVLFLSGSLVLIATWSAPRLLDTGFVRWLVVGSRLTDTRANRTLLACLNVLLAAHVLLSVSGYRILSFLALAVCLPVAIVVIKRGLLPAAEA